MAKAKYSQQKTHVSSTCCSVVDSSVRLNDKYCGSKVAVADLPCASQITVINLPRLVSRARLKKNVLSFLSAQQLHHGRFDLLFPLLNIERNYAVNFFCLNITYSHRHRLIIRF